MAESGRLLIRCTVFRTEGSNPSLSVPLIIKTKMTFIIYLTRKSYRKVQNKNSNLKPIIKNEKRTKF